jgi:hypothetical protein
MPLFKYSNVMNDSDMTLALVSCFTECDAQCVTPTLDPEKSKSLRENIYPEEQDRYKHWPDCPDNLNPSDPWNHTGGFPQEWEMPHFLDTFM